MLSVSFIRENSERVRRDLLLRNTSAPIDRILELDERRRELLGEVERLRAERNAVSKEIGTTRDAGERQQKIEAMRAVADRIDGLDADLKAVETELNSLLLEVPNIVDPSVPPGPDEHSNVVVETVGELPHFDFTPRPHWELGDSIDGIDFERGVKMSGSRFFALRGPAARLHRALIQFMLNEHAAAGFTEYYLPYMLNEASLVASGQLPKFRENLYRDAEDDYYFIPTAEVAFVNLYRDEIIPPGQLPLTTGRAHALLSPRKDERRPRCPRDQAPPPVREGRDVRLLRAGEQRRRVGLAASAREAHPRTPRTHVPRARSSARAISASTRRRLSTSRSGRRASASGWK